MTPDKKIDSKIAGKYATQREAMEAQRKTIKAGEREDGREAFDEVLKKAAQPKKV